MNGRIVGIRNVVSDIRNTPLGFHVEVWSERDGNTIRVWTSEYLTQNSWTVGHPEGERRIMYGEQFSKAEWFGEEISLTEAIRREVAKVWGEE